MAARMLQCVAVRGSELQCVASCCSTYLLISALRNGTKLLHGARAHGLDDDARRYFLSNVCLVKRSSFLVYKYEYIYTYVYTYI